MVIESNPVTTAWWPQDPTIPVLAAVIESSGRWLLCQRPDHKQHGGLWEFPGGKLELGESLAQAARRELREELNVEVVEVGPILFRKRDPNSNFEIVFVATTINGEPVALEHSQIAWLDREGLRRLSLAPCDLAFATECLG